MGDKALAERNLPDPLNLQIKISKEFRKDLVAFLDWLRGAHPGVYVELE
jgi:hypothetical protein